MKNFTRIFAFLVVILFVFTSCRKNWDCDCQWKAETFSNNQLVTSQENVQNIYFSQQKKKDAEELCEINRNRLESALESNNENNNPGTEVITKAHANCKLTKAN